MDKKVQLGSNTGIQLTLNYKAAQDAEGLLWAKGRLIIGGEVVWALEDEEPIEWTWLDLFEFLGRAWPWLLLEQDFPLPLKATSPASLRQEAEKRWATLSSEIVRDEEEQIHRFLHRHDFASAMKGIFLPSVFLLRQGERFLINIPSRHKELMMSFDSVVDDLNSIGEGLKGLLAESKHPRALMALKHWDDRQEKLSHRAIELLSGLRPDELSLIEADKGPAFWEHDAEHPTRDSVILAAARMSKDTMPFNLQKELLELLKEIPGCTTEELDSIATEILSEFKEEGRPHDQGYLAARKLRDCLNLDLEDRVEPEQLLRQWQVQIKKKAFPDSSFEAVALWGENHGPAVVLNYRASKAAANEHRVRSTLAHEICHLVLDRHSALPVAEVLNGRTPEKLEQRARAFAAEFLLPRASASKTLRQNSNLKDALYSLSRAYGVSLELAAWQIHNSDAYSSLNRDDLLVLQQAITI
ncbi:ImmA/IrrE family metallo-endopeptidase [Natronospirillum operosum]|uniref:ImmA/IrrE family metallo-endopeptidase n=1 Tax=Natronospirillum operosum TaxID=2759953 RepID=A0A4Z0WIH3_9GAMM|nr:ImmA/IrrE family metallo-endopeptidase [Natronospirillum operosum]TGG95233.1 ImmA/IrrE family metallo-endopeptidase [Natronospirillum operosum]